MTFQIIIGAHPITIYFIYSMFSSFYYSFFFYSHSYHLSSYALHNIIDLLKKIRRNIKCSM